MDENSPFARFTKPNPSPDNELRREDSDPPVSLNPARVLANPQADGESISVAVAYPVAILLPESGPHACSLAISIPGAEPVRVTLSEPDAKSIRAAIARAFAVANSELSPT